MTKIIAISLILILAALSVLKAVEKTKTIILASVIGIIAIISYLAIDHFSPLTPKEFPYKIALILFILVLEYVFILLIGNYLYIFKEGNYILHAITLSPIILLLLIQIVYFAKDFPRKEFFTHANEQMQNDGINLLSYNEDLEKIAMSKKYALALIKKSMNKVPNAELFDINDIVIQDINGKTNFVVDLKYSSYFKWDETQTFPGYFVLDATDLNSEVEFVEKEYKYASSAYFSMNAERKIREEYPNAKFLGEPTIEIDDEGNVYYTLTFTKPINVTKGDQLLGVYVLNAHTGEGEFYEKGKIPTWIDGGISPLYAYNVAFNYVHWERGRLNIYNKGRKSLNDNGSFDGMKPILVDGQLHYMIEYSTYKNRGNHSMVGYILMNSNTGEFFKTELQGQSLIDSSGAVSQGQEFYIEKKHTGRSPMLYSLDDQLVWVVLMHDGDGLLQNYFVVSATNQKIFGTAKSLNVAMENFQKALKNNSSLSVDESSIEEKTVNIIAESVIYEQNGDYHFVYIKSTKGEMFVYSSEQANPILFTQKGDEMVIKYKDFGAYQINPITEFK